MNPPKPFDFPSIGNNQQNIYILKGKLNEVITYLNRENVVEPIIECAHENAYSMNRNDLWRCKDCKTVFKKTL
jgi:hypothetical protein